MENEELVVDGFAFQTLEEAEIARDEGKKIEYIESRMNYEKPEGILPIYKKMVESSMFQTQIGYLYLYKLRGFLKQNFPEEVILEISTKRLGDRVISNARRDKQVIELKKEKECLKKKLKLLVIANIIFVIAIIAMFVIAINGTTPTILNYENVLQDRYAIWDQELKEREQVVREKEQQFEE